MDQLDLLDQLDQLDQLDLVLNPIQNKIVKPNPMDSNSDDLSEKSDVGRIYINIYILQLKEILSFEFL
jgi:hypothetical protein